MDSLHGQHSISSQTQSPKIDSIFKALRVSDSLPALARQNERISTQIEELLMEEIQEMGKTILGEKHLKSEQQAELNLLSENQHSQTNHIISKQSPLAPRKQLFAERPAKVANNLLAVKDATLYSKYAKVAKDKTFDRITKRVENIAKEINDKNELAKTKQIQKKPSQYSEALNYQKFIHKQIQVKVSQEMEAKKFEKKYQSAFISFKDKNLFQKTASKEEARRAFENVIQRGKEMIEKKEVKFQIIRNAQIQEQITKFSSPLTNTRFINSTKISHSHSVENFMERLETNKIKYNNRSKKILIEELQKTPFHPKLNIKQSKGRTNDIWMHSMELDKKQYSEDLLSSRILLSYENQLTRSGKRENLIKEEHQIVVKDVKELSFLF